MKTVPELRKAVIARIEPAKTVNGRPVYCMPNGRLVSKAKKNALVAYLADLDAADVISKLGCSSLEDAERRIARYDRKIRKYARRTQRPGNVASGNKWKAKRERLASRLAGANLKDAA